MKKYLAITFAIILSSCVSLPLSPEAEHLTVLENSKMIEGLCPKVGRVNASSSSNNIWFSMQGSKDAITKMKNLAAKMGNVLVITKNEEAILSSDREGDVYKCPGNIVFKKVQIK